MDDFLLVLGFSTLPLIAAALFSLVTPPLGATLYLRQEILFGIALPPAGALAVAFGAAFGLAEGDRYLLYGLTFLFLMLLTWLLPLGMRGGRMPPRRREIVLASVFALSGGLTMLVLALSPRAETYLHYVLHGEILAVRIGEVWVAAVASVMLLLLFLWRRKAAYAFCLDEESLFIRRKGYKRTVFTYRLAAVAIVSGGILLIGPMLMTTLLILPALLGEKVTGMDKYMVAVAGIGFFGTVTGFLIALGFDLPPSPMAAVAVACVGLLFRAAYRN